MHAIILAGGFGTRLKSVIADVPKPLAPIAGRPFLAWLIDALVGDGVDNITLSVHHDWEKIRDYFSAHSAPVPIHYAVEETPLGTGGAMAFALTYAKMDKSVIVVNGDTFVEVDYRELYRHHCEGGAPLTMVLRHVPDTGRYGRIEVGEGRIISFQPGKNGQEGFINAGIYVISPELFARFPMPPAFSFEQDFLPRHVAALQPRYFLADDYFIDIGIPEDYLRACHELPSYVKK